MLGHIAEYQLHLIICSNVLSYSNYYSTVKVTCHLLGGYPGLSSLLNARKVSGLC